MTPPYTYSDRSKGSASFNMPESWMIMDNWADMDQSSGGQASAVSSADWDFNPFETGVFNNNPPVTTGGGPSVPWPSYPPAWGLSTSKGSADPQTMGGAWPVPQTMTKYGNMEPNMNMVLDQSIDWNWAGDGVIVGFGE